MIESRFFNLVDLQDLEYNLGIVKASKSEEPAPPLQPYSTKLKPDEIWLDPP